MPLIGLFCTCDIPGTRLSRILETTYAESIKLDCFPNLALIPEPTRRSLSSLKLATYPTLKGTIRSPFPTWTIQEIEDFILENTVGDIVSNRVFAIIDKRTLVDDSIILGQISNDHKNPRLDIVRLSPMHLNADAISVELGLMTVKELIMIEAGRDGAQSPSDLYRRGSARRV